MDKLVKSTFPQPLNNKFLEREVAALHGFSKDQLFLPKPRPKGVTAIDAHKQENKLRSRREDVIVMLEKSKRTSASISAAVASMGVRSKQLEKETFTTYSNDKRREESSKIVYPIPVGGAGVPMHHVSVVSTVDPFPLLHRFKTPSPSSQAIAESLQQSVSPATLRSGSPPMRRSYSPPILPRVQDRPTSISISREYLENALKDISQDAPPERAGSSHKTASPSAMRRRNSETLKPRHTSRPNSRPRTMTAAPPRAKLQKSSSRTKKKARGSGTIVVDGPCTSATNNRHSDLDEYDIPRGSALHDIKGVFANAKEQATRMVAPPKPKPTIEASVHTSQCASDLTRASPTLEPLKLQSSAPPSPISPVMSGTFLNQEDSKSLAKIAHMCNTNKFSSPAMFIQKLAAVDLDDKRHAQLDDFRAFLSDVDLLPFTTSTMGDGMLLHNFFTSHRRSVSTQKGTVDLREVVVWIIAHLDWSFEEKMKVLFFAYGLSGPDEQWYDLRSDGVIRTTTLFGILSNEFQLSQRDMRSFIEDVFYTKEDSVTLQQFRKAVMTSSRLKIVFSDLFKDAKSSTTFLVDVT